MFKKVIFTDKDHNLLTICNNNLRKHFNLMNFIDFVTLAYIRGDSLKISSNTSKCVEILNYTVFNVLCICWSK